MLSSKHQVPTCKCRLAASRTQYTQYGAGQIPSFNLQKAKEVNQPQNFVFGDWNLGLVPSKLFVCRDAVCGIWNSQFGSWSLNQVGI
jgi:hypothetical protein